VGERPAQAADLAALQTLPEGVYIAMNGKVFDPLQARKNIDLDRFEESKA
jgi:L-asparaginase